MKVFTDKHFHNENYGVIAVEGDIRECYSPHCIKYVQERREDRQKRIQDALRGIPLDDDELAAVMHIVVTSSQPGAVKKWLERRGYIQYDGVAC